jgi:hypothetical protein
VRQAVRRDALRVEVVAAIEREGHAAKLKHVKVAWDPPMASAPIVLVPGFWLGAWAWDDVVTALRADGTTSPR